MKVSLRIIENCFVVFSLLILSNALFPVLNQMGGLQPNENNPITQGIFLIIRIGIIFLAIAWYKRIFRIVIKEKLLWPVVGMALVSVFWSAAPLETLRNSIVLLASTLFGIYLAARYNLNEQLRLLAWALGIGAILSLILAIALPSYGVMGTSDFYTSQEVAHSGVWKGIYGHKNILGQFMSLGALVFFFLTTSSRKYLWVKWVGFCLCVSLLLLSTAKTALIVFLVTMAVIPLYRALRWNQTFALAFFIVLILVSGAMATLFLNNAETILGAFGRDTTLTGRTLLWPAVLYKIWQRPWLGYGYGGFWLGWEGESADVWRIVRWEVLHAHNGFLDLWLNIGLLGLLAFALSFLATCLQAVSWVRRTNTAEGIWPLAYLTFLILANLGESSLMRLQSIWILYVALSLSMQNMSENLAASKTFSQQKVKRKTMKQIMQNSQGGGA